MNEENKIIGLAPRFSEELSEISKEYKKAREIGDNKKADGIIEGPLRCLLQRQLTFLSVLQNTPYVIDSNINPEDFDQGSILRQRTTLTSVVLDDNNWSKFSQELTSRSNYDLLQLTQNDN